MSQTTSETTATTFEERRAQLIAELADHTIYELVGGEGGVRAIVERFYELMDADAAYGPIRTMHQADLGPMRVSLFEFLSGWLGGPPLFIARNGSPCLTAAHAPYRIDQQARDLWLGCMERAMEDVGMAQRYREALMPAFTGIADAMRNDCQPGACQH